MTVLVTGAAGFVGSHLAERLVEGGAPVRGIDRMADFYDPASKRENIAALLRGADFEFVEEDLNTVDLDALLEDVDVIFHLAGQPGVRVSWGDEFGLYLDDNVLATQRLLEAVKERGLQRFVLASSSSIYGDAESFPDPRVGQARAGLALRHDQARGRAPLQPLLSRAASGCPPSRSAISRSSARASVPDMAFNRFIEAALGDGTIEIFGDGAAGA